MFGLCNIWEVLPAWLPKEEFSPRYMFHYTLQKKTLGSIHFHHLMKRQTCLYASLTCCSPQIWNRCKNNTVILPQCVILQFTIYESHHHLIPIWPQLATSHITISLAHLEFHPAAPSWAKHTERSLGYPKNSGLGSQFIMFLPRVEYSAWSFSRYNISKYIYSMVIAKSVGNYA